MSFSCIETYRHRSTHRWSYRDLDRRQEEVRAEVAAGAPGRLIFSEVAPVVTLGFRRTEEDLLLDRDEYARKGIELLEASRGGRATYHGPGQWIVFPIDSLERLTGDRRGVRKTVDGLLEAVARTARERFPRAEARDGKEAGLWTEPGTGGAKFAALGIRVVGGIVQHGISVNVFATPESFAGIRPCGLDSAIGFLESAADEASFLTWRSRLERSVLETFPGFSPRE